MLSEALLDARVCLGSNVCDMVFEDRTMDVARMAFRSLV